MSDSDYRLTVTNQTPWPVFLNVGPWAENYSSCITMGDDSDVQLGGQKYLAAGASLTLHFWRSGDCHGEQGWLALRAAYNGWSTQYDGAWQQFWYDTDGGFEQQGNNASYPNTLTNNGRDGDTALYGWTFSDAADWPAGWSRSPLENPIALAYTNQYDEVWSDAGSGAIFDCGIYKPKLDGYFNLGFTTLGPKTRDPIGGLAARAALVAKPLQPGVVVPPDTYNWIGDDHNSGADQDCSWWTPVPPPGFVALGTAFVNYHGMPPPDAIACVRSDLAMPGRSGKMLYADRGSGGSHDIEIFAAVPDGLGGVQVGASIVSPNYIYGAPPKYPDPVTVLKPPALADMSDGLTAEEVGSIIAASGPLLVLHPEENCMPISADIFVAAAARDGNYLNVTDPHVLAGDLATAKAYVFADYVSTQFTDLQFWFFYGYNGATFVDIDLWVASGGVYIWSHDQNADNLNCGQHQGDWENITLRVDNQLKQVVAIGYTSHGDTDWYMPQDGKPRAYSALHMHGSYPMAGEWLELAGWEEKDLEVAHLEVEVYSRNICADGGQTLDCSVNYQIVQSNFLSGIETPVWLGPDFQDVNWGPVVEQEDDIVIDNVPIIGSYTYDYKTTENGPSTPNFLVS